MLYRYKYIGGLIIYIYKYIFPKKVAICSSWTVCTCFWCYGGSFSKVASRHEKIDRMPVQKYPVTRYPAGI